MANLAEIQFKMETGFDAQQVIDELFTPVIHALVEKLKFKGGKTTGEEEKISIKMDSIDG